MLCPSGPHRFHEVDLRTRGSRPGQCGRLIELLVPAPNDPRGAHRVPPRPGLLRLAGVPGSPWICPVLGWGRKLGRCWPIAAMRIAELLSDRYKDPHRVLCVTILRINRTGVTHGSRILRRLLLERLHPSRRSRLLLGFCRGAQRRVAAGRESELLFRDRKGPYFTVRTPSDVLELPVVSLPRRFLAGYLKDVILRGWETHFKIICWFARRPISIR